MVNLAFWQLRRLEERRHFNARVDTNTNEPVAPVNEVLSASVDPSNRRMAHGARHRHV